MTKRRSRRTVRARRYHPGELPMNLIRSIALATFFAFSAFSVAQTAATTPDHGRSSTHAGSNADQHMQVLSERLELTADQQAKIRPIVSKFLEARQKVLADASLSDDQRHARIQTMHDKADHQVREFLNNDQKKKLDQLEQEHP
jgi:Spy/CpxP family protein refolding chaperone